MRLFARKSGKKEVLELPVKGQVTYLLNGRLPVDADGTLTLPKIPTREYVGVYLDHWKITED